MVGTRAKIQILNPVVRYTMSAQETFYVLRPRQNGFHFADGSLKCMLLTCGLFKLHWNMHPIVQLPISHRLERKLLVSDPGMHHGTCITHVPWCMSGSLTAVAGKRSRHSRRMHNPQFCVSVKRLIASQITDNLTYAIFYSTNIKTQWLNNLFRLSTKAALCTVGHLLGNHHCMIIIKKKQR